MYYLTVMYFENSSDAVYFIISLPGGVNPPRFALHLQLLFSPPPPHLMTHLPPAHSPTTHRLMTRHPMTQRRIHRPQSSRVLRPSPPRARLQDFQDSISRLKFCGLRCIELGVCCIPDIKGKEHNFGPRNDTHTTNLSLGLPQDAIHKNNGPTAAPSCCSSSSLSSSRDDDDSSANSSPIPLPSIPALAD